MKVLSTFEITKGFDRWLHLVDVELKPLLEKYKIKLHFACTNDDQTRVMTPKQAIDLGANYLVIGRPITGAEDITEALNTIYQSIN